MPTANGTSTRNGQKTERRFVATRLPTHAAQTDLHMLKRAAGRIRLRDGNGRRSVILQAGEENQVDAPTKDPIAPGPLPGPSSNGDGVPVGDRREATPALAH